MEVDKVLEEYRTGDDNKRLSLFMGFRELRELFERIEQMSSHDDFRIVRFPWSRKHQVQQAA